MEDTQLEQVVKELRSWCATKPQIKKLWIYGSIAKGLATEHSDLDIAYLINLLESENDKLEFRNNTIPAWQRELTAISPWRVHLEPWAGTGTSVAEYVSECNILVYERA